LDSDYIQNKSDTESSSDEEGKEDEEDEEDELLSTSMPELFALARSPEQSKGLFTGGGI